MCSVSTLLASSSHYSDSIELHSTLVIASSPFKSLIHFKFKLTPNKEKISFHFTSLFPSQWRIPRESSALISRAASTPLPPPPPQPPYPPPHLPDLWSNTILQRPLPPWPTVSPLEQQLTPLPTTPPATSPGGGASGRPCAGTGFEACA